ncbi:hypothetical protein [Dyella psychrodurans]|uniref:hypothetical protein n=1 Tax=Dyella psychrodurans TaxID=1927960 RepID=UPI0011C06534|nr:hypothetical protein [Dyella psychrodurans]
MKGTKVVCLLVLSFWGCACNSATPASGVEQFAPSAATVSPTMASGSLKPERPGSSALPAKELGPKYQEGMSYMAFRTQLLSDQWSPAGDSSSFLDSMLGSKYKEICADNPNVSDANICALSTKLPEAVTCESTGSGSCLMSFIKDHMTIDVNTSGDIESIYDAHHKYGFYADSWHISVPIFGEVP